MTELKEYAACIISLMNINCTVHFEIIKFLWRILPSSSCRQRKTQWHFVHQTNQWKINIYAALISGFAHQVRYTVIDAWTLTSTNLNPAIATLQPESHDI